MRAHPEMVAGEDFAQEDFAQTLEGKFAARAACGALTVLAVAAGVRFGL